MDRPDTRLYHSSFRQQSDSGLQNVFNRCKPRPESTESNVVRQHEKRTGMHRPVVEDRTFSKRCRVASPHGSPSSLSCGDGGDVGTDCQSVEGGNVAIRSPSSCGQAESSHAAWSVQVDSHAEP